MICFKIPAALQATEPCPKQNLKTSHRLDDAVETLIRQGVNTFVSGGAIGFDWLVAASVANKKTAGANTRLILALPCRDWNARWTEKQRLSYQHLMSKADEIIYVSETYDKHCMKKRNVYMVTHAQYCVCALIHEKSGTGQTVRLARKHGLSIIDITPS